jgi:hypothetical protein
MARQRRAGDKNGNAKTKRALVKRPKVDDPSRSIQAEIGSLRALTLDELRRRWRAMTGRKLPNGFPRFLLLRMVAYELQARVFGDLDKASIEYLDRIGDCLSSPAAQAAKGLARAQMVVPPVERLPIKPGSLLVREWKGVLHRVTVLKQGFAWNGEVYDSLSTIARAITGTEWSGPRFFGLRERKGRVGAPDGDQSATLGRVAGRGSAGQATRNGLRRPEGCAAVEASSP